MLHGKLKQCLLWSSVFLLLILLTGCGAPSGNPEEVINKYYQNVKDGNFETAYDIMTEQNKKNISKEDFNLFQQLNNEIQRFKDFKIEKVNDLKDKELDGTIYVYAVEFNVTEIVEDYYDDKKEKSNSYKAFVVGDNGVWRIYKDLDIKKEISANYVDIGWMYLEGKGKDLNRNEAVINFKLALEFDRENADAYYGIGAAYEELGRYDESIEQLNLALAKNNDNKFQSNIYNILGLNYAGKEDYQKAEESYNKAIELNPDNEYARNNLSILK